jgi:hypothetical protein
MKLWLAALLVLAPGGPGAPQGSAWNDVWDWLDRLRGMERGDPAAEGILRSLREDLPGPEGDPRRVLVQAELERWSGREPGILAQRLATVPLASFGGREAWYLAEILPQGPARVAAVLHALDGTPNLSREELLDAWNVAGEEVRALRLADGALPIQERLYQRARAAWSGSDLARTLGLLGRSVEADALLAEVIAQEEAAGRPTQDLWSQRGIQALGAGNERLARDYLGHALGQGSMEAALRLARADLAQGRLGAARMGLRPPILSGDDTGSALRGWGLALLPAAHARAARPTLGPGIPHSLE